MKATLHHIDNLTEAIKTFWFEPEQKIQYTAGQYTEISLPHPSPDDRGIQRWFTLSSSPTEDLVSITTKFAPEHGSTFKQTLAQMEPGTEVDLADPMGDFVLPKLAQTPLVFVAGGMGLTPFRSMFKWMIDTGEKRDIKFIYGVRSEEDIIFQDIFDEVGIHATIVVSEPSDSWGGERGHLSAEMILGLAQPSEDALIYMSGPEPMVESLEADMKKHGIAENRLVGDFFPGYEPV